MRADTSELRREALQKLEAAREPWKVAPLPYAERAEDVTRLAELAVSLAMDLDYSPPALSNKLAIPFQAITGMRLCGPMNEATSALLTVATMFTEAAELALLTFHKHAPQGYRQGPKQEPRCKAMASRRAELLGIAARLAEIADPFAAPMSRDAIWLARWRENAAPIWIDVAEGIHERDPHF